MPTCEVEADCAPCELCSAVGFEYKACIPIPPQSPLCLSIVAAEADPDDDGWPNADEYACGGTDMTDPASYPDDADGDGICDTQDACVGLDSAGDTDGDGTCDDLDADDDNDGVDDASDPDRLDTNLCGLDADGDSCDDCAGVLHDRYGPSRNNNELDDGVDTDGDGICDAGDGEPTDPLGCGDLDADGCDDCVSGGIDPANDGADADADGACDENDTCVDVDGDGLGDGTNGNSGCSDPATDTDDGNGDACGDTDFDGCDDCVSSAFDSANDGVDLDGDGACDVGDTCVDVDGDGLGDGTNGNSGCSDPATDTDDGNDDACGDTDFDGCDDCSSSAFDPGNDGVDLDGDGICDGGDGAPGDPDVCLDSDGDGCDDCSLSSFDPSNDGVDADGDGICDLGDPCVDVDGDGLCNPEDPDDDGDGWSDSDELGCGGDPLDATSMPVDDNGDGICDVEMLSFFFLAADNAELATDIAGDVTGTDVRVAVPGGVDVSSLVPTITTGGGFVDPASGVNIDFSAGAVEFVVSDSGGYSRSYTVFLLQCRDDFGDNEGVAYSGWTEINLDSADYPLYVEQSGRLEWAQAGNEVAHLILSDCSSHGREVSFAIDQSSIDSVGGHHAYFFWQDEDNWYRLSMGSGGGATVGVQFSEGGVVTDVGVLAPWGGNGRLEVDVIESPGVIEVRRNGTLILTVEEVPVFAGGKVGFGGVARRPIWDNFEMWR